MTTMESSINLPKFFIFIILSINLAGCKSDVSFELINKAGVTVELFWVNPAGRDLHPISSPGVGIANATAFRLSSFVGHEFEVREMPSERTGECANENKVCHSTNFVVPETENECKLFACCTHLHIVLRHVLGPLVVAFIHHALLLVMESNATAFPAPTQTCS